MRVVQVNLVYDDRLTDPDALLDHYWTLTGWSDALAASGASVSVVQRFSRDARVTRRGVDYRFCADARPPHLPPWASSRSITKAVADAAADVVHVNGLTFPVQTWMLRRHLPAATAVVVQSHSSDRPIGRAPALRLSARATRGSADAFLFAADAHVDPWRRAGIVGPHDRTYQVMEASTTFQRMPAADARAEVARTAEPASTLLSGSPAILWVGRLNANKDPLTVLDGFERALERCPNATLTMIYSTDELLQAVRARVERSSPLRERVALVGRVPHNRVAAFLSLADIYVVGSRHEGSGYALMEACACGAVPVVTDIPTFRILTCDGSFGTLWPPGDAAACARALGEIGASDLQAIRTRMMKQFDRELSWNAIGRRAIEVYRQLAEHRPR